MRRSVRRDDAAGLAVLQPHYEAARTCTSYHKMPVACVRRSRRHSANLSAHGERHTPRACNTIFPFSGQGDGVTRVGPLRYGDG